MTLPRPLPLIGSMYLVLFNLVVIPAFPAPWHCLSCFPHTILSGAPGTRHRSAVHFIAFPTERHLLSPPLTLLVAYLATLFLFLYRSFNVPTCPPHSIATSLHRVCIPTFAPPSREKRLAREKYEFLRAVSDPHISSRVAAPLSLLSHLVISVVLRLRSGPHIPLTQCPQCRTHSPRNTNHRNSMDKC